MQIINNNNESKITCDRCNNEGNDEVYYICKLNKVLCLNCYKSELQI